jgi:organic radical activating enzyme
MELDYNGFNYFKSTIENSEKKIPLAVKKNEKDYIDLFKSLTSKQGSLLQNIRNAGYNRTRKHYVIRITNKCNLSCNYCKLKQNNQKQNEYESLSWTHVLKRVLPDAKRITLMGGEPILHPHFKAIVKYIANYNSEIPIVLVSNASVDFMTFDIQNELSMISRFVFHSDNIDNDDHCRIGFDKNVFMKNIEYLLGIGFSERIIITSTWISGKTELLNSIKRYCIHKGIRHKITLQPSCFYYTDRLSSSVFVSADEFNNKFNPIVLKTPQLLNPSISA